MPASWASASLSSEAADLETRTSWRSRYLALTLALGAAAGAAVSLAAFLLARYGPSGDDWSFRGNGALAAYTLVPAVLAGGWTAVVLYRRRQPWPALGTVAAGIGVALAALDAALLPLFGSNADQTAGPMVLLALVAWMVAAPVLAIWFPRGAGKAQTSIASSIGVIGLWFAGVVAGLVLLGFALPAGS